MSSVVAFLSPFITNQGLVHSSYYGGGQPGDSQRDFLRELERNVRIPLDWRAGATSAHMSLSRIIAEDNGKLVAVVDFALRNIRLGYSGFGIQEAAEELDRALTESGSVWSVAGDAASGFYLQRRVTETGDALAAQVQSGTGDAEAELRIAREEAYGRNPDPRTAYRHAVLAVEAAAIPVVSPNNASATLGTVIGDIRSNAQKFSAILAHPARRIGPSADDVSPVEVVLAELDLLWANHTDRHAPPVPPTQQQAEWAVHTATMLVQIFRAGWVR